MRFNHEQYRAYRRKAGIQEKDGIWDTTIFKNGLYCFATKQWLGINGRLKDHQMLGKRVKNIINGQEYIIDNVSIHWYDGYYYSATMYQVGTKSHAVKFIANINCVNDTVLEGIGEFNKEFEIVSV